MLIQKFVRPDSIVGAAATVAGLEDLSAQSCRRYCVDGFVRSPDDLVSAVVWISDPAAFPPPASVAGCDRTPECPLDCPSTDRSLRLATDATIYRSRSGIASMAMSSSSGFEQWVYGIDRFRRGRHGKTGMRRLIGSIRRDCLDHVVVFGERHLRHLLNSYQKYYNEARTHLSLHKDAPIPRAVQTVGRTLAMPVLGGLHHQYFRA
jgi:hypothetical protein